MKKLLSLLIAWLLVPVASRAITPQPNATGTPARVGTKVATPLYTVVAGPTQTKGSTPSAVPSKAPSKTPTPMVMKCGVTADGFPFCGATGTGKACSKLTDCLPRCKIAVDGRSAQCAEDGTGKTCYAVGSSEKECLETACQPSADGRSGKCVVGGRGARCNPALEGTSGDVCKDRRCDIDGKCVFGGYGKPCKGVEGECPISTCAYLPEPDGTLVGNCADGSKSALVCKRNDQPDEPDINGDCPDEPKLCIFDKDTGRAQCRLKTAAEKRDGLASSLVAGAACSQTSDCDYHVCQEGVCVQGGWVGWKGGVPCDPSVDSPGRCGEKRCNGYSCSLQGQGMRCEREEDCSYNACMPGYYYKRGGAGGAPPGMPTPDPSKPEDEDTLFCIIVEGNAPDQCGGPEKTTCPQSVSTPNDPASFDENSSRAMWKQRVRDLPLLQSPEQIKNADILIDQYATSVPKERVLGAPSATVLVVMFQDLKCGMCKSSYGKLIPPVIKNYVGSGKVRFLLLDYPLGLRDTESRLAQATRCAEEQGAYHEFTKLLYAEMANSTLDKLMSYADSLGMDSHRFSQCLESSKYRDEVEREFALGSKLGVNGTPTFFINGERIDGAIPYERMASLIELALAHDN